MMCCQNVLYNYKALGCWLRDNKWPLSSVLLVPLWSTKLGFISIQTAFFHVLSVDLADPLLVKHAFASMTLFCLLIKVAFNLYIALGQMAF